MMLRYYIIAYFKLFPFKDKLDYRFTIPMDRGGDIDNYIHNAALVKLSNTGLLFTDFYAVIGKQTVNITDKVNLLVNEFTNDGKTRW